MKEKIIIWINWIRHPVDFYRNIVATVNLECRLDLKTIALHARNAEYNPKVSRLLHLSLHCDSPSFCRSIANNSSGYF